MMKKITVFLIYVVMSYSPLINANESKMNTSTKITSATTMLIVKDVKASAEFYRDKLGFKIEFVIEEGTPFASVYRDGYKVYLESCPNCGKDDENSEKVAVKCGVYFMVDDVDALYEEFKSRGVEFRWAPQDQVYGNRDMKLLDNSGYQLLFATDLEKE